MASEEGQNEVVHLLLSKGANPDLKNNVGEQLSDFSPQNSHMQVLYTLTIMQEGKTAKQVAYDSGHYLTVDEFGKTKEVVRQMVSSY